MNEQEKILTNSFVANSYNSWLDNITNLFNDNNDNPAALSELNSAYINGSLKDLNSEDTKKSLSIISSKFENVAKENFDSKQESEAINLSKTAAVKSKDIAISSIKNNEPEEIQTVKMGSHLNILKQNRDSGIISEEFYNTEVADFGKEVALQNLVNVLFDDSVSENYKIEFLKTYITGRTDDPDYNDVTKTEDRINSVAKAFGIYSDLYNAQQKRENQEKENQKELFNLEFSRAASFLVQAGIDNPDIITEQQQRLYNLARTDEDFKRIKNLETIALPTTTHPLMLMKVSRYKSDGTWNEEKYMDMLVKNQLSATDAKILGEELSMPYETNKKHIGTVINKAKAELNYSPENQARFNSFVSRLQANENISNRVLTPSEALSEANKELREELKTSPLDFRSGAERIERLESVGIAPENFQQWQAYANESARKQLKIENPTYEDMKPFLREKVISAYETRRRKNILKGIQLPDGTITTDKSLIIPAQLGIMKKIIEEDARVK